ncbi:hypothetical protein WJX84_010922 [Apatococcus fuscideae]|uniref:Uncharacterized protein n=1 Tax=Apatococcus fuscideae TaxID=2026836 RepID=A0AAW1T6G6_9CHLO
MASFTPDRQQALIAAVAAAAPTSDNVAVTLNNIVAGSVAVDVIVEFLDGSIGEAQYLANLAQSASPNSLVFPLPASLGPLASAPQATISQAANPALAAAPGTLGTPQNAPGGAPYPRSWNSTHVSSFRHNSKPAAIFTTSNTSASAPNVNPFSTSATIPYYYIPMTFANLMSAALTTSLEQALLDAVLASVPSTSNVWSYLSFTSNADLPSAALEIDVFVFFSDGDMPTAFQFSRNVPYLGYSANFTLPASLGSLVAPSTPYLNSASNPSAAHPSPSLVSPGSPSLTSAPYYTSGNDPFGDQAPYEPINTQPYASGPGVYPVIAGMAPGPTGAPAVTSPPPSPIVTMPSTYQSTQSPPPPPPPSPVIGFQSTHTPAPDAAPVATAASIPVVTISYALPAIMLADFTPDVEQAVVDAVTATLPAASNVNVYLTNIRAGSVKFDTVVQFLDGNTDVAQALTESVAASVSSNAGSPSASAAAGGFSLPAIQLPAYLGKAEITAIPTVLVSPNPNAVSPPPPPMAAAPSQPPPPPSTSFEVTLAQYTVASFNSTYQDAFQETLEDYLELSPSDLSITLSNFHDGSLIFTTLVVFLNGDAAAAAHLYAVLNQDASVVFGNTFGDIYVDGEVTTASVPPPPASGSHLSKGDIAGIVIGTVGGWLIVVGILAAVNGALLYYYFRHRRTAAMFDVFLWPMRRNPLMQSTLTRAASCAEPLAKRPGAIQMWQMAQPVISASQ